VWRDKNPEKAKAQAAKSRAKNRDKINERQRLAYTKEKGRSRNIKALYGITPVEYERMYADQAGLCAICVRPSAAGPLHIDHNHSTGRIRELLCSACNTGLGLFSEDAARLLVAAAYVNRHNKLVESK
jgi:hypothetical protein